MGRVFFENKKKFTDLRLFRILRSTGWVLGMKTYNRQLELTTTKAALRTKMNKTEILWNTKLPQYRETKHMYLYIYKYTKEKMKKKRDNLWRAVDLLCGDPWPDDEIWKKLCLASRRVLGWGFVGEKKKMAKWKWNRFSLLFPKIREKLDFYSLFQFYYYNFSKFRNFLVL